MKFIVLSVLLLFFSASAFAQNTKGDRPVRNQRQVRETKGKSVKKKEKGSTRDIANRRLRTKDKSSANRANANYPRVTPYSNRSKSVERAARPRGRVFSRSPRESKNQAWTGDVAGHRIRTVKPGRRDAARTNVYPQKGPFVRAAKKHPDKKPPVYSRTIRGKNFIRSTPRYTERAWKGGVDRGPIRNQSVTGSIKNTYPKKGPYASYAKKRLNKRESPVSNRREISQVQRFSRRPLTGSGQVAGIPPSRSRSFIKSGRKNVYWGKLQRKEKPFLSDITGGPLRTRNFRSQPGGIGRRDTLKFFGRKPVGDRANRVPGAGHVTRSNRGQVGWLGDIAGWRLRKSAKGKREVAGKFVFPRKMSISGQRGKGGLLPGGGFQSRTKSGEQAQLNSVPGKVYGRSLNGKVRRGVRKQFGGDGTLRASQFSGNIRRGHGYSQDMAGYSGNIKRNRIPGFSRAGHDYSGNIKRNRIPGFSREGHDYSGNIRRSTVPGFSRAGHDYSGNIKRSRIPGFSREGHDYSGNIRRSSVPGFSREGHDYSGNIKRSRIPGFSREGHDYSGNIRRSSVPGFSREGHDYSGNIRRSSVPGFSRAGHDYAGNVKRRGLPASAKKAGRFSGSMKYNDIVSFTTQGADFGGRVKAKRPEKGGGSVSGVLWNNDNHPLKQKELVTKGADYSGRIRLSRFKKNYVQNPNSSDESLKKRRPDETTYKVAGLQIKVREAEYARKPNAAKGSLPGKAPSKFTIKASEYASGTKQTWRYRHNPNSAKEALDVRVPGKANARIDAFQGNVKMHKYNDHRLHPDAKFAHGYRDNVAEERTLLMNVKLMWAKLFRKSENQPENLKEKITRPKYDKREKGMWND